MTIAQENFILEYLTFYKNVDMYSIDFHEKFHEKFGGNTKMTVHGTMYVNKAMYKLKEMYKNHKLRRCSVVYDFKVEHRPSWGYSYWLS